MHAVRSSFVRPCPMLQWVVPVILAVLATGALVGWSRGDDPTLALTKRLPGTDRTGPLKRKPPIDLRGEFRTGSAVPADLPGSWPCFRGAARDNVGREEATLARSWPRERPPELWRVELGEGYAGAAVAEGRVYLLDYDMERRGDRLRCLSLRDGAEIWSRFYAVEVRRQHGMSRTVPAVGEGHVVTLGPKCHVLCVRADSGDFAWGIDLVSEYGTTVPPWYAGQCPLIENGRAIIAPGGPEALLVALDLKSGETVWTTPNPEGWRMSHTSVLPLTFAGKRMYVYAAGGGVVGVDAESGAVLWQTAAWTVPIANVPTPVDLGGGRLLLTGGYNAGAALLQLHQTGGGFEARFPKRFGKDHLGAEQQTPVFYENHIYAVLPKGRWGEQLACFDRNGSVRWRSGKDARFGLGPFMIADGLILLLDDEGELTVAEAVPTAYVPLLSADILEGHEAWAPLALAGGRLLARDLTMMVCLDMRARP